MIHGKYIEVKPVIVKYYKKGIHIFYFCAGRGLGKTYSSLDLCRELSEGVFRFNEDKEINKFLYLRRTGVEVESISNPAMCPFKKYNANEGYDIYADYSQSIGAGNFYNNHDEKKQIGYCAALSTFANLRGVDFSDIDFIIYDECLPETSNKRPLKDEGYLILNMLETINRNRALDGQPEIVFVMLSNPIDLGSDMLAQLDLTGILNNMIFKNQQSFTDYDRSLHIEKYVDHPVSKEKGEKSMVYKFAKTTGFNDRALSGDFVDNDLSLINRKVKYNDYTPLFNLENVTGYVHKSTGDMHLSQVFMPSKYRFKAVEREKFRAIFYWQYKLYVIERKITYDSFMTKTVFEQMIRFKL